MKTILALIIIITFGLSSIKSQEVNVDLNKSTLVWTGKKIGGEHTGTIQLKKVLLEANSDKIISGKFVIDMRQIKCTDIKDQDLNSKMVLHLKSDDFFGVKKYPVAVLDITEPVIFTGGKGLAKGELKIKNIIHPIEFEVIKSGKNYNSTIKVDRTKYDIKYGSKKFFNNLGDKAIDDEFLLEVNLIAN